MSLDLFSNVYSTSTVVESLDTKGNRISKLLMGGDPLFSEDVVATGKSLVGSIGNVVVVTLPNGNYQYTIQSTQTIAGISGNATNVVEIKSSATEVNMISSLLSLTTNPNIISVKDMAITIFNPKLPASNSIVFNTSYTLAIPFYGNYTAAITWTITDLNYNNPDCAVAVAEGSALKTTFATNAVEVALLQTATICAKTDEFGGDLIESAMVTNVIQSYPGDEDQNFVGLANNRNVDEPHKQVFLSRLNPVDYLKGEGEHCIEKAKWLWERYCTGLSFQDFYNTLNGYIATRLMLSKALLGDDPKWLYGMYNNLFLSAVDQSPFHNFIYTLVLGARVGDYNKYMKWNAHDDSWKESHCKC